ncbi:hypothetical protein LPJ61_005414 [Coemansia biformis]|uniref:Uncharacterized protein n=1 Tax=Coemansia biformis TaxID=1286918 RepID=A0A9W8CUG1_9FUNG|nr:hypothetical protein LPJ61_005414 [Coemansia biformis]
MPVMRRSMNHIMNKGKPPSPTAMVLAWKESSTAEGGASAPPEESEGRSSDTTTHMPEDGDDDTEDPLTALRSKEYRAEMVSQLTDESGTGLMVERIWPLWGIFGWLPLDELSRQYHKRYRTRLWTRETRSQVRPLLKDMRGLSEWGAPGEPLLFKNGAHLENPRRPGNLFVDRLVPEPLLFFFVVTTVLRAVQPGQGDAVAKLWEGRYKRAPLGLQTVTLANRRGETKWSEMGPLWDAAVAWMCKLGREAMNNGCGYLRDRISGWSYDGVGAGGQAGADEAPAARADPTAELVFGLRREDLGALLEASPVLLSGMFTEHELVRLEDEL